MWQANESADMLDLIDLRSLATNRSIELGQVMGYASILMSIWIALNVTTNKTWIAGAVFPAGTLAFAVGMAAKQRSYVHLGLTLVSLLLVSMLVVLGRPENFSLAFLISAGVFFNVLVFLLGYVYPDMQN